MYSLKIELIGWNKKSQLRILKIPGNFYPAGVRLITGYFRECKKFNYINLQGRVDFSESNSTGSRGVHKYFLLEDEKLYWVSQPITWRKVDQYFCIAGFDEIRRISEEEAIEFCENNCTNNGDPYKMMNEESARIAKDFCYPELTGSPRQIAWAETIRQRKMEALWRSFKPEVSEEEAIKQDILESWFLGHTSAPWWIDNRFYRPLEIYEYELEKEVIKCLGKKELEMMFALLQRRG